MLFLVFKYHKFIVCIYLLLNLMSSDPSRGIGLGQTITVLGYCLLPLVLLAIAHILLPTTRQGYLGLACSIVAILWSTSSATAWATVFHLSDRMWLVAYPILLVYSLFALITVF